MKSYTGPSGERVTASDQAGQEFIDAYARHAQGGVENSRYAMGMLANIVHAAGGIVCVPYGGLGRFGEQLQLTVWQDAATRDLVLKTTKQPPASGES